MTREPLLLTPGPLTTAPTTREAMLRDWGSRDPDFIALNRGIRDRLVEIVGGVGTHVCVPMQGSGTFAVEAMLGTLVPPSGRVLILVNGAYGRRMARICERIGRSAFTLETPEDMPPAPADVADLLSQRSDVSHVAMVHCETTSGILNPVAEIAQVVAAHGKGLLIDAMSAFGALPMDAREVRFDALAASSNKCLEGVPGVGFVLCRQSVLETCNGHSPSLSLDLHDQWRAMESNGQWRFTPPTHVLAAFSRALDAHAAEGGVFGRYRRYADNCRVLVNGMRELGFETLLPDSLQAPIIVTFRTPTDPAYDFDSFYEGLKRRGYVIYPGKLTEADSFRIGCIGHLGTADIEGAIEAVQETLEEMMGSKGLRPLAGAGRSPA